MVIFDKPIYLLVYCCKLDLNIANPAKIELTNWQPLDSLNFAMEREFINVLCSGFFDCLVITLSPQKKATHMPNLQYSIFLDFILKNFVGFFLYG